MDEFGPVIFLALFVAGVVCGLVLAFVGAMLWP